MKEKNAVTGWLRVVVPNHFLQAVSWSRDALRKLQHVLVLRSENGNVLVGKIVIISSSEGKTVSMICKCSILCCHVQTGSGAHPASYPVETKGSFPGGKAARVWSWSQECMELHLHGIVLC